MNPPLKSIIEGWKDYEQNGYSIKRIDDEVVVKYPYMEKAWDILGEYTRQVTKKYPFKKIRLNPSIVINEIEEHVKERRRIGYSFVR